jgi:hypothetical protein
VTKWSHVKIGQTRGDATEVESSMPGFDGDADPASLVSSPGAMRDLQMIAAVVAEDADRATVELVPTS